MLDIVRVNKNAVKAKVAEIAKGMDTGVSTPAAQIIYAKVLSDLADGIMKEAKARYKLGEEVPEELAHVEITERPGHDVLNYEEDPVYSELKAKLDTRKKQLDAAVKNSRNFGAAMIDEETGEVIPVVGVKNTTANALIIKY